jgi:hypothetical protein
MTIIYINSKGIKRRMINVIEYSVGESISLHTNPPSKGWFIDAIRQYKNKRVNHLLNFCSDYWVKP